MNFPHFVVDAVVRRLPGVLGDEESANNDSFAQGDLDAPYYTKPEEISGLRVPEVLLSGHHAKIQEWRKLKVALSTHGRAATGFARRS